jgi:hypothetical protein
MYKPSRLPRQQARLRYGAGVAGNALSSFSPSVSLSSPGLQRLFPQA